MGGDDKLEFVQKNSGQYELEIKAEDAGSYFVTAQAVRTKKVVGRDGKTYDDEEGVDSVRSGVTVPYSPEFAELVRSGKVRLITYQQLIARAGLSAMRRPQ